MKYAGMPMGMWTLFAGSFRKDLTPAMCRLDYTMSDADGASDFVREYTLCLRRPLTATAGIINEISRIKAPPRQRRGRCPHRPGRMHCFYGSLRQIRNFPLGRQSCWLLQQNFIFSRIP